jgi:hypothetical protein
LKSAKIRDLIEDKLEGNGLVFKKLKRGTGSSENDRNSTMPDKEIQL